MYPSDFYANIYQTSPRFIKKKKKKKKKNLLNIQVRNLISIYPTRGILSPLTFYLESLLIFELILISTTTAELLHGNFKLFNNISKLSVFDY